MPVPDYQTLMLPLLKHASDGKPHYIQETISHLSDEMQLTEDERSELLPSGRQSVIYSRVHWARTYLKSALLLESSSRGEFKITRRGLEALASNPKRIDNRFLNQFPEFVEFKKRSVSTDMEPEGVIEQSQTPDELLESSYRASRAALAQQLLDQVKSVSPAFFEQIVIELLLAMGYGGSLPEAGFVVGQRGDGGIDGIIHQDKLGLDRIYVQAKRWDGATVGRPAVQAFIGSLAGQHASKGVFITTSKFANNASEYLRAVNVNVTLIDGEALVQYMIDYDVGVVKDKIFEIKRLDTGYFEEM